MDEPCKQDNSVHLVARTHKYTNIRPEISIHELNLTNAIDSSGPDLPSVMTVHFVSLRFFQLPL
jgi:hypothetical protein